MFFQEGKETVIPDGPSLAWTCPRTRGKKKEKKDPPLNPEKEENKGTVVLGGLSRTLVNRKSEEEKRGRLES